jgi:NADH-quinone oxidoreductase subunit C
VTESLSGRKVAARIRSAFPQAVVAEDDVSVTVGAADIVKIAGFLRDDPDLDCKYLTSLTAVDWLDHFEVVYHLSSLAKNHILCLKVRANHDEPEVPSLLDVWQGADLQEREAFDLMGITFTGHPRMRRVFLWDGFPGHPLRKDFLALPGGFKPGLQRFPFEFPTGENEYPSLGRTPAGAPIGTEAPTIEADAPVEMPAEDPDA